MEKHWVPVPFLLIVKKVTMFYNGKKENSLMSCWSLDRIYQVKC